MLVFLDLVIEADKKVFKGSNYCLFFLSWLILTTSAVIGCLLGVVESLDIMKRYIFYKVKKTKLCEMCLDKWEQWDIISFYLQGSLLAGTTTLIVHPYVSCKSCRLHHSRRSMSLINEYSGPAEANNYPHSTYKNNHNHCACLFITQEQPSSVSKPLLTAEISNKM